MNRISIYILIIMCCSLLFSCVDEYYYAVPKNYYLEYDKSDTLVYKCIQTENLDSLVVTHYGMRFDGEGNETVEILEIYLEYLRNKSLTDKTIAIWISPGSPCIFRYEGDFSFDDQYCISENHADSILDIKINNIKYRNVMINRFNNPDSLTVWMSKIWYDYEYGMVKYTLSNDTTFELLKKPF